MPVIAGGGIGDARGVLAAMALGADGIYMGTRFMVTHESESHLRVKQLIVEANDVCTVGKPDTAVLCAKNNGFEILFSTNAKSS